MALFHHPVSIIMSSPSCGGKSTLAFEIIKKSAKLVANTNDGGFDSVWILYRSQQPLYQQMQKELDIPVYLFEKTLPDDLAVLLKKSQSAYPIFLIDDGLCPENQDLVLDLFTRLGHHLSISIILICQTLFDSRCPTLRLCHRNVKALFVFNCPRDQSSLRTLVHQMMPCKKKAAILLTTMEEELRKPYSYVLIDFQPQNPPEERFKTNILGEREPFCPVALVFRDDYAKSRLSHRLTVEG